jgi:hypothetical protein
VRFSLLFFELTRNGDVIHYLRHARGFTGNRLRRLTLQALIYKSIQIDHMINRLHGN